MKKELDNYDIIIGLSDYSNWSYCAQDGMWYEDEKEVLPQPAISAGVVSDLYCEIKVDYENYFGNTWEEAEKDNEIENYVRQLIDGSRDNDSITSVILFKSKIYEYNCTLSQDSIWLLELFIQSLKEKKFTTQYIEQFDAIKFIFWELENNQVRFAIQSYNNRFNYLKFVFDVILDKNVLISKLLDIIDTWKKTIYSEIKKQEKLLNKPCTNPYHDYVIDYFFPEFQIPVKTIIESTFKNYEEKYGIKVLFAVENGSRAWEMASKNSDFDIRFVFKRKEKDYISLNNNKDVLEAYYNERGLICNPEEAVIDMVGFDIIKFTKLLSKSNPTTIEWLMSDIVYYGNNNLDIKQFIQKNFNPKTLIQHYISLCKKHYNRYIKENKKVTYKIYLYMIRGLLNAIFVYKENRIPPSSFAETLELMKDEVSDEIYNTVKEIIKFKSSGMENDAVERIKILDKFIEEQINKSFDVPERQIDISYLNQFLHGEIFG